MAERLKEKEMNEDKLLELIWACTEKTATDFLAGKPVDLELISTLRDVASVFRMMKSDRWTKKENQ